MHAVLGSVALSSNSDISAAGVNFGCVKVQCIKTVRGSIYLTGIRSRTQRVALGIDTRVSKASSNGDSAATRASFGLGAVCGIEFCVSSDEDASQSIAVRIRPQDDVTVVGSDNWVGRSVCTRANVNPVFGLEDNAATRIKGANCRVTSDIDVIGNDLNLVQCAEGGIELDFIAVGSGANSNDRWGSQEIKVISSTNTEGVGGVGDAITQRCAKRFNGDCAADAEIDVESGFDVICTNDCTTSGIEPGSVITSPNAIRSCCT